MQEFVLRTALLAFKHAQVRARAADYLTRDAGQGCDLQAVALVSRSGSDRVQEHELAVVLDPFSTGGRFEGVRSERGQLFVLSAERGLIQAGARTAELDGNGDWDSNILRNTEHAALLVADKKGKIAIEAQLITTEPEMAESLASIVRGLISLQVFNDDMDPEVSSFLQNTNVSVNDNKLTVSVALDPEVVVAAIE